MAEQRVSNDRKKELEQLDSFQKNLIKTMAFLKEYRKQVVLGVSAVVAVILVFSGVMYSLQKSEDTAALMIRQALIEYAKAKDPDKGYLEVEDNFQTIFKEYSNTIAGKQARVKFAKICYEASKFDQSFAYYKEALDLFEDDGLMKNFLLTALGHVSVARKDNEAAKQYFQQVEKSDVDLLKDEAGYALAMLYEASGNKEESKKMYEKIVSDYKDSIYIPIAKSKLASIK
ncbi:MAG: tetratricopeptide repeat protein [Pseudomonadota bacterium]